MLSRNNFIDEILETLNTMIMSFEEREIVDSDFSIPREMVEELYNELDALHDE